MKNVTINLANRTHSSLAVVKAVVEPLNDIFAEDARCVGKAETTLAQIPLMLRVVPPKLHRSCIR